MPTGGATPTGGSPNVGGSTSLGGSTSTTGTEVQGTIVNATWTAQESPYRVTGNILVASLTINEGVRVEVGGDYSIEVAGRLTAVGSASSKIVFTTTAANTTGWEGIVVNAAQSVQLSDFLIENALNSGLRIVDTPVAIQRCSIQNCGADQGGAIYISGSTSVVAIRNCLIEGNVASNYFEAGGGLFMRDGASVTVSNTVFANNSAIYANARGGGIFLCGGTLMVNNSTLVANGSPVYGNGYSGIAVNTGGLTDCTGGTATIDSCILFNNVPSQILGSGVTVSYSDVQGSYSGTGNIATNPIFSDTAYHLLDGGSPCIDTGNPAADHNDGCLPPALGSQANDMGAYGGPGACHW